MDRVRTVVLSALRSPIGRFLGAFMGVPSVELAAGVVRASLKESGVSAADVDELILGCARQAGQGPNLARQVAVGAGLPVSVPAFTVNMACASSLKALVLGNEAISSGRAEVVVVVGVESMSRVPFLLERHREGYHLGHAEVVDGMMRDGFLCPLCRRLMGETAEHLAKRYSIGRKEQDAYAAESQRRCEAARREGRFREEIVPVELGIGRVLDDENPREGVTVEALSRLAPAFRAEGTVHAGNSCGIADGAAAAVLVSEERARRIGRRAWARIAGWSQAGVEPIDMGLGPVPALRALARSAGWSILEADLVELNEAFAAQVLACDREIGFDRARLNVNGGAIALGHPVGATGLRLVATLLHELGRRRGRRGIATLCASGGLGMAVAFESELP